MLAKATAEPIEARLSRNIIVEVFLNVQISDDCKEIAPPREALYVGKTCV